MIRSFAQLIAILLFTSIAFAQTFEVNGQNSTPSTPSRSAPSRKKGAPQSAQAPTRNADSGMGWGSSIEVARQARAAQDALRRHDYRSAVAFAQRATKAAPQNPDFWFLLAYSARLSGQNQLSVDAYNRGLQLRPSSFEGLSGLAQTYARMGRNDDAKQLLDKVLAAKPRSGDDLRLAGELFLYSDPKLALSYLQRADAVQSAPRTELLMARAYQRLGQQDESMQMLERARNKAPKDPDILRAVAAYYRESGQFDKAISTLKSVPLRDANALAELAYTYQVAGNKNEAADTYVRAADVAKNQVDIQLNAAQALVNAGQFDRAENMLKRAEALKPNHYRVHAVRGQIAYLENHDEDAIREYQAAISGLPDSLPEGVLYPITLHIDLYQLYRDIGDAGSAKREINAARNLLQPLNVQDATRPEFLRLRAAVEIASNDAASAERDLKEAMSLARSSTNIVLNYANLLWRTNRKPESIKMYTHALELDATNAAALSSLGYLSRETGDPTGAERYFEKLRQLHPDNYVPYLALGDMYTERRQFDRAQSSYEKAHELAPTNPLVVAGGINSALEGHQLPTARNWLERAKGPIAENPQVMREHERYLTMTGKYPESAELGYKVIQKLPKDPEAPVYLAYDLLFLGRYQDAMDIVSRFRPVLPRDKDLPLIAGYVHAHNGEFQEAINDFTMALERDPNMATGYMNRGYVLNDMRMASRAQQDFKKALQLRPDYGEAHLGLAYSDLQLRRAKPALKEADAAEKSLGDSRPIRLARAEAYRQQVMLDKAEVEYRAALKFQPNDLPTHLALSDALYRLRRYDASIDTLNETIKTSGQDPMIYAQLARSYAKLRREADTVRSVQVAEQQGGNNSRILLATADALLSLGEREQAMQRYSRALDLSEADRLQTRLALARLFANEGKRNDAHQQIGLGFAEARVSDAEIVTAENYLDAGDILMSTQDFELAERFFQRAQATGADEMTVAIGLANAHLALGETSSAETLLANAGDPEERAQNYDYLISRANAYRQRQDTLHALSDFARANSLRSDNESSQQAEYELAGEQGRQLTENLSVGSMLAVGAIFEDENIYQLDARLRGIQSFPTILPPPRRSVETFADARFHFKAGDFPVVTGFVGERNARGTISIPSSDFILRRNTYDTIFNGAVNPVLHVGNVNLTFTPGLQFTIRRDMESPRDLNQDLFRQFVYLSSSPIGNWLWFNADAIRETGPFTEQTLHSRDLSASLNFTLGRPWGKTALITGYGVRDVLFRPAIREYYQSSSYIGIERKFGSRVRATALAEYLRGWRVQDNSFAIAQSLRPGFSLLVKPATRWTVEANGYWSKGQGFHAYDNVSNSILVSYMKPFRGAINDGAGNVSVSYPLRFSVGFEQQTFYDFPGHSHVSIVPVVKLTLF
jgi:tetratricopeptide (TPR) repeat protein